MTGTKSPFKSLTINASTIGLLLSVIGIFGVQVAPDAVPEIVAVGTGLTSLIAIIGRIRAKTLIQPG